MNHTTKILISLALLAVIAGGVWYARKGAPETPPADSGVGQVVDSLDDSAVDDGVQEGGVDTSDWKTYRNEEVGFTMKYPENWAFHEGRFAPQEIIDSLKAINWAVGARAGRAIDVYFDDTVRSFESNESEAVTSTNIKINGIQSTQYHIISIQDSYGFSVGDEMIITVIPIKEGSASLTLWGKEFTAIYNKILSSIEVY